MTASRRSLGRPGRAVVAIHHANNETGVIQPIAQAAERVRAAGGWLHVDAIQTAGKIPVDMAALDADTLTLSGHKLGGPQGVGALVSKAGAPIIRTLHGAGQERGLRPGTLDPRPGTLDRKVIAMDPRIFAQDPDDYRQTWDADRQRPWRRYRRTRRATPKEK